MGGSSKSVASIGLVLLLNLVFFSMVSSNTLTPAALVVSPQSTECPKLDVCVGILQPPFLGVNRCCPFIQGLVDLDAALCLCAAIKIDIGGIIQIHLDLLVNLVLNTCGRKLPSFTCK